MNHYCACGFRFLSRRAMQRHLQSNPKCHAITAKQWNDKFLYGVRVLDIDNVEEMHNILKQILGE